MKAAEGEGGLSFYYVDVLNLIFFFADQQSLPAIVADFRVAKAKLRTF